VQNSDKFLSKRKWTKNHWHVQEREIRCVLVQVDMHLRGHVIAKSFAWLDNIHGSSLREKIMIKTRCHGVLIDVYGIRLGSFGTYVCDLADDRF
jgi:hypothetical protein